MNFPILFFEKKFHNYNNCERESSNFLNCSNWNPAQNLDKLHSKLIVPCELITYTIHIFTAVIYSLKNHI